MGAGYKSSNSCLYTPQARQHHRSQRNLVSDCTARQHTPQARQHHRSQRNLLVLLRNKDSCILRYPESIADAAVHVASEFPVMIQQVLILVAVA